MEEKKREGKYDVNIKNVTDEMACLGIAGPRSREILTAVSEEDLSQDGFPFMCNRKMTVADIPVIAIRISYTGKGMSKKSNGLYVKT